jgi:flagellar protein FliS
MTPPTATPPQAYRENAVLCAAPAQLVVMLYDGARRFLRQAADAMRAREVERAHNKLRQAEQIVAHLDGVLDYEQGAALAEQLHAIYQFCLTHLDGARINQEAGKLEETSEILGELRESWVEIAHR